MARQPCPDWFCGIIQGPSQKQMQEASTANPFPELEFRVLRKGEEVDVRVSPLVVRQDEQDYHTWHVNGCAVVDNENVSILWSTYPQGGFVSFGEGMIISHTTLSDITGIDTNIDEN